VKDTADSPCCQCAGWCSALTRRWWLREPEPRARPSHGVCRAIVAWVVLGAVWWCHVPAAPAQQPVSSTLPNEYTVKAVFLYSFGRYVEWPASAFSGPADPFVIAIVGEDAFGGALDEIAAKKTIQERRILVRRFASAAEYHPPCHILFVSRSLPGDQQAALMSKAEGKPVFVVGESPGLAEKGAIANFFIEGDRVRFEINADAARKAQLRMDAKLLNLGKPVGMQRSALAN